MVEVGERQLQAPGRRRRVEVLGADDLAGNLERRPGAVAERGAHALQVPLDLKPVRSDLPWNVAERPPVPGEANASLELLDALQSDQELGTGSGVWPWSKNGDTRPSR